MSALPADEHAAAGTTRSPSAIARVLQLAWASALIGLPLGFALALADVRPYSRPLELLPVVLDLHVIRGLLYGAVGVAIGVATFALLGRWIAPPQWRARLAAFIPWLYAEVAIVDYANRELLPGLSDPVRGAIHASLAIALLVLVELVTRRLRAWYEGAWQSGLRAPVAGLVAIGLVVLSTTALGLQQRTLDERPNVIVILLDVLGAQHLGTYGYERATSPHIDAFAEDAVVFEEAISQSSFTKTSISSLFTSLYPYRHGVYRGVRKATSKGIESDTLDRSLTTLAEAFRDAGYFTIGWVQNSQIRGYMGFDQGFDLYRDGRGQLNRMMRDFMPWFATWGTRLRFFAYIHVIDIHGPYLPRAPFDEMFGPAANRFRGWDAGRFHDFKNATRSGEAEITMEDADQLRALYDGEIAGVDEQLGELFSLLKRQGLYDDALIVVTGDHGEAFLQHGDVGHSNTPYDELIHVPLIVKLPHARHAGLRIEEPVALVDVAPTLLAIAGAPPIEGADGVSLLSRLEGGAAEPDGGARPIVSEYESCIAIRTEAWKYLSCSEQAPELYDLAQDPGETSNVWARHPDVAAELGARVQAIEELRTAPRERVTIDDETVEALKALGYL